MRPARRREKCKAGNCKGRGEERGEEAERTARTGRANCKNV